MSKIDIWQAAAGLLPLLSYIIGRNRNKLRVPKPISVLVENADVIRVIVQGIEDAEKMRDKSDDEKRAWVRERAKSELCRLMGDRLPDSSINFLIEHALVKRKGG